MLGDAAMPPNAGAEEAARVAIQEFSQWEAPVRPTDRNGWNPANLCIAAVGTIATVALENPLLRHPLAEVGIHPRAYVAHDDLDSLTADDDWHLALVISPFKQDASSLCDRLGVRASATGVVDTLLRTQDCVIGVNTNSYAAEGALMHLHGSGQPQRVLLIGTGATARSVLIAAQHAYPKAEILVIGRRVEAARDLVSQLGYGTAVTDVPDPLPDTVIHTTTVGEADDAQKLETDVTWALRLGVRVLDVTNRLTALQQQSVAAGCITLSGLFMQSLTNIMRIRLLTSFADRRG